MFKGNGKSKRKIKSVQIQLTTDCNECCVFCRKYTWDKREIPLNVLRGKINKYKSSMTTFQFSGGEPLLYTFLKDLNNILIRYSIPYKVHTSLSLPLDDERKKFFDTAEEISVGIDAVSKNLYNRIRLPVDRIDAFCHVIRNINKIKYTNKKKLKLCTVVNKLNVKEIPYMVQMAEEGRIQHRFYPLHTNMEESITAFDLEWLEWEVTRLGLMESEFTNIAEIFEPGYFDTMRTFTKCRVRNNHRVIDEQGREYTCVYAVNECGKDWNGRYGLYGEFLEMPDKGAVLDEYGPYDFCRKCSRYRKANECSEEEFKELRYL